MAIETVAVWSLLAEIGGAIHFRSGVAERYPDDERNIQCVESLGRLEDNLGELTEDDPRIVKCFETYRDKHMAAGNGELHTPDQVLQEHELEAHPHGRQAEESEHEPQLEAGANELDLAGVTHLRVLQETD